MCGRRIPEVEGNARPAATDGWISPGASVCDPSNYGSRSSLWAYFIELESGQKLWAGAVVT